MVHHDPPTPDWVVEHRRGTAQELHDADTGVDRRRVVVASVVAPALVLGSTQSVDDVDPAALARRGIDLARRRSGGGAVLLVPDEHLWVDLVIPSTDPLWREDVGTSAWWLGEAWAATLSTGLPGPVAPSVHRDGMVRRDLGRIVCFAGTGPGEVSVGHRKVVGISQRRTRSAARFQCVLHRRWDPAATVSLLRPTAVDAGAMVDVLERRVGSLGGSGAPPGWSVVEDLLAHLP